MAAPKDNESSASDSTSATRALTKVVEALKELQDAQTRVEGALEHMPAVVVGMLDLPEVVRRIHGGHAEQLEPLRQSTVAMGKTLGSMTPVWRLWTRTMCGVVLGSTFLAGVGGGVLWQRRSTDESVLMREVDVLLVRQRGKLPAEVRQGIDELYKKHGFTPLSQK